MNSAYLFYVRLLVVGVLICIFCTACEKDNNIPHHINIPGKLLFGKYAYQVPSGWDSGDIFYELIILRNTGPQSLQIYYNHEARWSPDGQSIAFCVSKNDGIASRIFMVDANQISPEPQLLLTDTFNRWTSLAWSPDGQQMALGSFFLNELHVFNMSDKTLQKIETGIKVNDVDWSLDGKNMLFSGSDINNIQDIYIYNLYEKILVDLTEGSIINCSEPRWSPDGKRILFSSSDQIMIMDANGKNRTTLGNGRSPDWSFNGEGVAFSRYNEGIFLMSASGSNVEHLYKGRVGDLDFTTH